MAKSNEWFAEFFDDLYGQVLAGQFTAAQSRQQARVVKQALGLRKGQAVLDCPCGLGRLTIPLAKMGLAMTGADLTEGYLRAARRQARCEGVAAEFVRRDMRWLEFEEKFDAVVNWFGSFGYFDDAGNLEFCRQAWRALKPGGSLLIEQLNKTWLIPHIHGGQDEVIAGVRIVNDPRFDARTSRIHDTWTMTRGSQRQVRDISIRLYSAPEMRALLKTAGFTDVRVFGTTFRLQHFVSDALKRFTRHSRRFIVVATKGSRRP